MNRIKEWWTQLMESTKPRNPDHYFSNKGEGGKVSVSELEEIVHGTNSTNAPTGEYVECRIGERIEMRVGFSEAVTHLGIDDTMMEAEVLPDGVQFFGKNNDPEHPFSFPVTYAEAGLVELNGRLFYRNK